MQTFTQLRCPQGCFDLRRLPHDPSDTLRAWDSADELLLQRVDAMAEPLSRPLLLNDSFGALACALAHTAPMAMGDSYVAQLAAEQNLARNQRPAPQFFDSTQTLPQCRLVLMKQTKNLRYFEHQLQQLASSQEAATPVLIAGMQKYLSRGFLDCAAKYLTDFEVGRGEKKARVLSGKLQPHPAPAAAAKRELPEFGLTVVDTANVFAAGKIDIGSRFLLQHMPQIQADMRLIDLGCGNGILGLKALQAGAEVYFVDESRHALQAVELALPDTQKDKATLVLSNCLQQFTAGAVDMVLCNPPFHQQQAVATEIAWQMFREAKAHLRTGGDLYVVANRHLGYQQSLNRIFGNATLVAGNNKFVVLTARNN